MMLDILIGLICGAATTTFLLVIASNLMESRGRKAAYERLIEENKC